MEPVPQPDPYNLARFAEAQAQVMATALAELKAGHKRTHWMWFVFPQLRGLGHSDMAHIYGIGSFVEAQAYLADPLLGARLDQCTRVVMGNGAKPLAQIFGAPDDIKFQSSMTLFSLAVSDDDSIFRDALDRYCEGRMDPRSVALLKAERPRAGRRAMP